MLRVFTFVASWSEKKPWLVVLAVALVTAFMIGGASQLTTELSQEAMMPKDYPSIEALNTVEDEFGGISYEYALITVPEGSGDIEDVTSAALADKIDGLSIERLEKAAIEDGGVLDIETYVEVARPYYDEQTGELDIMQIPQSDIRRLMSLVSMDREATLVKFQLNPELGENEQATLAKNLEDFIAEEFELDGVVTYVSGGASMMKDAQEIMRRDTSVLMLAAFLFIMLILYLTFRRVSDIFLPLLIIFLAMVWLIGLMGWAGIPYTTMSVAIMPLMLGINIAYVIHILSRYYEEREGGRDLFLAATTSIKTVGIAVFLTAITTVFGFASFMISDLPQMRDFGLVCMSGIIFSFILSLTLLPALVVIRDRRKASDKLESHLEKMRKRRREARYGKLIDRSLAGASLASYRHHWIVLGVLAVFVLLAGFAVFRLETGADVKNYFPEDMPSTVATRKVTEYFGPQNPDIMLIRGEFLEPENLRAILEMEDAIVEDQRNEPDDEDYYTREAIFSLADMIAQANNGRIPASREAVEQLLQQPGFAEQVSGFVSADGEYTTVSLMTGFPETEDEISVKADILTDKAMEYEEETGLDITATGMTVLISDIMGNLLPTQLKTSGLALLLCLLVLIVVFKSFYYGLATLTVVIFGIGVEIVMLYALGWPLDFMSVTISSLLIGIGVDFGIHVTHRFREEHMHDEATIEQSIKATVLHVGRALVAAAFTTAGVFAILGLSQIVPMQRFGWTVAVGLIAALIGAVLVLPSLLAIIAKRNESKNDKAPNAEAEGTA